MAEVDPLTKVGAMLAIRQLAEEHGGITDKQGEAALEWAINRGLIANRPGTVHVLRSTVDDLMLTRHGQLVVAAFWKREEARKRMRKRAA
jgi:hypothetical protein